MPGARLALWRNRFLRFTMGASATVVTALVGILRNKWFAHHLEASGIGILAQIVSSQGWLGTAAGMGLGLPVARAVGSASATDDRDAARRVVHGALALVAIGAAAVAGIALVASPALSRALLGSDAYAPLIRISAIGIAGVALQQTLIGLFAGRSDLKAPLTLAIVGGAVSLSAALLLVPRWGLTGGVLAAALLFPAGCAGALLLHRREYAPLLASPTKPWITSGLARSLLAVSSAGLLSALVEQGTFLTLRSHYVRAHGIDANGYLQAGLAISQQVGSLFYAYLSSYAFGKISGLTGAESTRSYTRKHWISIILLASIAMIATRLGAGPLLRLLYSHRFDPAQPFLAWALVGELGRVGLVTWSLGSLPLGGVRLWLPISLVFPATLAISYSVLAVTGAGVLSFPKAYAVAGLTAALLGGAIMSGRRVSLRFGDLALFLAGAAALTALAAI